jgi:hypothetical protein
MQRLAKAELIVKITVDTSHPSIYDAENPIDVDDEVDDTIEAEMTVDDAPQTPTGSPSTFFLSTLVQPLLTLIHPTSLSFPPFASASPHPPTTSALSAIHVCAFECLNNIFLSIGASPDPAVAADREAGRKVWDEVWRALGVVGIEFGPGQERRQEIWENAVGVLWGIGNIWKGSLVWKESCKTLVLFPPRTESLLKCRFPMQSR